MESYEGIFVGHFSYEQKKIQINSQLSKVILHKKNKFKENKNIRKYDGL